jgi:hypothetical protein
MYVPMYLCMYLCMYVCNSVRVKHDAKLENMVAPGYGHSVQMAVLIFISSSELY